MSELNESQAVSEQLIQQHGLDSVADLQVEAHGNIYSVRDALTECPPFAKFVTGLATSIEFLPPEQAKEVMTQAVRNMAIQAPDDTETKKKLTSGFLNQSPRTNLT
jgi:hypothetical protein